MSATLLDERKYQKLLGKALPVVIQTEAEYRGCLTQRESSWKSWMKT